MKKLVRIAIYSRKSRFTEKGDSVGNQIEIAIQYINTNYSSNEYNVETTIFEDDGFSGGNIERPEFKKFLAEENKKPFDVLICYRLDRISRNIADFSGLMDNITKLGTSFVSIKEQFDTKTPMGRAMMYIASVFAQLEREVIAERVRDNMIELAKTGRWLGGTTPTGYSSQRIDFIDVIEKSEDNIIEKKKKTACKLIPIDEEIEIVQKIMDKFLELKSLNKLEIYFLENKITSKNNLDFSSNTLRSILTNPVYAPNDKYVLKYFENKGINIYSEGDRSNFDGRYGLIAYGKKEKELKDWIIAVGLHKPAINSGITWVRVQELIENNKEKRYRANCKHDFLFSGILKCSNCGSYMRPKISQNGRFYYVCELKEKSHMKRCSGKNINGKLLDKLVIQKLEQSFFPTNYIYEELSKLTIKKGNNIDNRKEEIKRKIKNNKEQIKNLVNKLKYLDVEVIDYINEELQNIKRENDKLQEELEKQNYEETYIKNDESKLTELVLNIINNSSKMFQFLDIKSKKDILKVLIEGIKGNGKNIEIKLLNTKIDETTKMLLSDIVSKAAIKKSLV